MTLATSAVVSSAPTYSALFPIPQVTAFNDLPFPKVAEELFASVDPKFRATGNVTTYSAFALAKRMGFGAYCKSAEWQQTWQVIRDEFFPGIQFKRRKGLIGPREVKLRTTNPFPDGDTAKVISFKKKIRQADGPPKEVWVDYKVGIRMDGIDTPESQPSEKLNRIVKVVTRYLMVEHQVPGFELILQEMAEEANMLAAGEKPEAPKLSDRERFALAKKKREIKSVEDMLAELVRERNIYLGKLSGIVTAAFGEWETLGDVGVRIAPAYTLVADRPERCDTVDITDPFGRLICRVLAGRSDEGEGLLAGFLEAVLPEYMEKMGALRLAEYKQKVANLMHEWSQTKPELFEIVKSWKTKKPDLWEIVSPDTAPIASEVYSKDECKRLAGLWRDYCKLYGTAGARQLGEHEFVYPEIVNDIQSLMVFIGAAPPYPKYLGHLTWLDQVAEKIALGRAPGVSDAAYGLWNDKMFRLLRPCADKNDPDHSPAVAFDPHFYGDGKPLNPGSCLEGCLTAESKRHRPRRKPVPVGVPKPLDIGTPVPTQFVGAAQSPQTTEEPARADQAGNVYAQAMREYNASKDPRKVFID